ncbi:MAG: TRAP transporter small permease subunit [Rhodobacter sp.]|nr:TRAP transporter small permease subunit [Rhodobacter sp.]
MTHAAQMHETPQHRTPAPVARIIGWTMVAALVAFLINNVMNVGFDIPTATAIYAGQGGAAFMPWIVYAIAVAAAVIFVIRTPYTALRTDAMKLHKVNVYLIRAFFFTVLIVGVVDVTIALFRVENVLAIFFSEDMVRNFNLARFVGLYIHIPLIILSFILAAYSRTLGFAWLALMIVAAELLIVITRFVFSYEQAFMGDLVRYWYAALFLFASAYTLFDDGHVRVDILYAGFTNKTRGFVNAIGSIVLGSATCWVILAIGFNGKQSIINAPVWNFEITQTGSIGMFVKYQMAAFLGIFAATMLIQFISFFFEAVADYRQEPGRRESTPVGH